MRGRIRGNQTLSQRSYASLPSPSYSNVIIGGGGKPFSAMLQNTKQAILVDQFIGLCQSNTLTGDFSASLELAYLVDHGEITGRVKDCMLSDNLLRLLAGDVIMSSDREQQDSVLAPYVFFPEVNYTS